MTKRIYKHNVQEHEHGLGKVTQAPARCVEADGRPPLRGWEREHYFWIRKKDTADDSATMNHYLHKRLMIRMTGPRWHFYFKGNYEIDHIEREDLDEMFRVEPSTGHSRNDGHSRQANYPHFCALWGLGEFALTLWSAQWLSTARFNKVYDGAEQEAERGEAPQFAHDNPASVTGMEGFPKYDGYITKRPIAGWAGELRYLYQPAHCGALTTAQVLADPRWVAALNHEMDVGVKIISRNDPTRKRKLDEVLDARDTNGGDPEDPNDPRDDTENRMAGGVLRSVVDGPTLRPVGGLALGSAMLPAMHTSTSFLRPVVSGQGSPSGSEGDSSLFRHPEDRTPTSHRASIRPVNPRNDSAVSSSD